MRFVIFIPLMLAGAMSAAQASPLPTQEQYDHMTCTQLVQETMQQIQRNRPALIKPLTEAQRATLAMEMVNVVETRYEHQPCRFEAPASVHRMSPPVPPRAGRAGR